MQTFDPTIWLPQTKLAPPRIRADVVFRPRLLLDLQQAILTHALTLLSAPTGYGKTTILAMLHHTVPTLPWPGSPSTFTTTTRSSFSPG